MSLERREEPRQALQTRARLRPADARLSGEVLIEERGPGGLRVRSTSPLLPDGVVVLIPYGEVGHLHAQVVWTRREREAWVAGCRLLGRPRPPKAAPGDPALIREPDAWAVRALVVAGLLGLGALCVYAFLRFTTLIGESAAIR